MVIIIKKKIPHLFTFVLVCFPVPFFLHIPGSPGLNSCVSGTYMTKGAADASVAVPTAPVLVSLRLLMLMLERAQMMKTFLRERQSNGPAGFTCWSS